jgi:hypothetical protein
MINTPVVDDEIVSCKEMYQAIEAIRRCENSVAARTGHLELTGPRG